MFEDRFPILSEIFLFSRAKINLQGGTTLCYMKKKEN
jgi:hypothetical protein